MLDREASEFDARVDVELRERVTQMGIDRVRRDIELPGHLAVGHAFRDEPDDRQLRLSEALPTGLRTLGRDQPPADS